MTNVNPGRVIDSTRELCRRKSASPPVRKTPGVSRSAERVEIPQIANVTSPASQSRQIDGSEEIRIR